MSTSSENSGKEVNTQSKSSLCVAPIGAKEKRVPFSGGLHPRLLYTIIPSGLESKGGMTLIHGLRARLQYSTRCAGFIFCQIFL